MIAVATYFLTKLLFPDEEEEENITSVNEEQKALSSKVTASKSTSLKGNSKQISKGKVKSKSKPSSEVNGMTMTQYVNATFAKFEAQKKRGLTAQMLTPSYMLQAKQVYDLQKVIAEAEAKEREEKAKLRISSATENSGLNDTGGNGDDSFSGLGGDSHQQPQSQYLIPQRVIVLLLILHDLYEVFHFCLDWLKTNIWDKMCYLAVMGYLRLVPEDVRESIVVHTNIQTWNTAYYNLMGGSKASVPPPALAILAVLTIFALIIHPDGFTWIVLGKIMKCIRDVISFVKNIILNIREGKVPGFLASEQFVGLVVLLVILLYIHHTVTSDDDLTKTKKNLKKDKHGKRGKHKGRQRHGGNSHNNSRSKHSNRNTYHQHQKIRANVEPKSINAADAIILSNKRQHSKNIDENEPQSIDGNEPQSTIGNLSEDEPHNITANSSDSCPGRKTSFDSIDNSSDVSSLINSMTGSASAEDSQSCTGISLPSLPKQSSDNSKSSLSSKGKSVNETKEWNRLTKRSVKREARKVGTNSNSFNRSLDRHGSDANKRWPVASSQDSFESIQRRNNPKQQHPPSTSLRVNRTKENYHSQQPQDYKHGVKYVSKNSHKNVLSGEQSLTSPDESNLESYSRRVNVQDNKNLHYNVPYYTQIGTPAVDSRYTPGKIELASFLAQAGLVGAECARLLNDLADVDTLSLFQDSDFNRYQVDMEKRNRIYFLLQARSRRVAEMSNTLGQHQRQNFQTFPVHGRETLSDAFHHYTHNPVDQYPIRPPPGMDGFVSREDRPFNDRKSELLNNQVIGMKASSIESFKHGSVSSPDPVNIPTSPTITPRTLESGQFPLPTSPEFNVNNHQQSLLSPFSNNTSSARQQDDSAIEAEMSALGDQMVCSILDF